MLRIGRKPIISPANLETIGVSHTYRGALPFPGEKKIHVPESNPQRSSGELMTPFVMDQIMSCNKRIQSV